MKKYKETLLLSLTLVLVQLYEQQFLISPPGPWASPDSPIADLLLGSVPAGPFLQAAYEEGQWHGQDDDAAHNRSQHSHSEAAVLGPGDRCGAKVRRCDLLLKCSTSSKEKKYDLVWGSSWLFYRCTYLRHEKYSEIWCKRQRHCSNVSTNIKVSGLLFSN